MPLRRRASPKRANLPDAERRHRPANGLRVRQRYRSRTDIEPARPPLVSCRGADRLQRIPKHQGPIGSGLKHIGPVPLDNAATEVDRQHHAVRWRRRIARRQRERHHLMSAAVTAPIPARR